MQGPVALDPTLAEVEDSAALGPSRLDGKGVRSGLGMVVLLSLMVLCAVLIHWWTIGRFVQSTNDAFLQADQVTVAPKVGGYVEQVLVADNQEVAAGQPLVRIDSRDSRSRLDQAQAQVDQSLAAAAQARAQIGQQAAQIAQARAQLGGLRAIAAYAALQVERYGPLAQSGAESAEHLDQLRQNQAQADAQAAAAAAQLLAAQRQMGALQAQVRVVGAQTEQAQAQARQAGDNLGDAVVRASIAGRIGDRTVRPGQFVQPGTRLMSVVPVQSIYLVANFKETQLGRMRPGQPVAIKVDALGGQRLSGVVDSFAPGTGAQFALIPPNNATGNFTKIVQRVPVRIRLDAPASLRPILLPGLSASVAVDTRSLDVVARRAAAVGGAG
jgi:membrane fusion protein (multidrug efflux system)